MSRKMQPVVKKEPAKVEGKANMQVLRTTVMKALGEEESKQLDEDPQFKTLGDNIIKTPYPLLHLSLLRENSTELGQCIDAMITNIDGFGYRLVENNMEAGEEVSDEVKDEIKKEKGEITAFLDNVNFDDDITALRENTRADIESTGNGWWEVIRYPNKKGISSIARVEPHTCRFTKLDKESTETVITFYNKYTKSVETRRVKKKFRRIVQVINSKKVFFKEWGDPRVIDKTTGEVAEANIEKKNIANEIIHFGAVKSSRSPYYLPRYIGNLFSIYGSRSAEEINYITFENNNIPSMIIMVSNGQLTQDSIDRTKQFIESNVKGDSNRSSILIIEAEPATEGQINPGTMKMDIKDLAGIQKEDQLFQEYSKNNDDKIRRCFRLPPIFVGKSDDYTRSTAQESRKLADEQVFSPERRKFDRLMNRLLIADFGMKYHTFKSNSANVTNDQDLVQILSGGEKTGGMTPNLSREVLGDILNKEIKPYVKDIAGFDPDIPISLTIVERAKSVAGNADTGKIAPTQGQFSTKSSGENNTVTEKLIDIEKRLIEDIYKQFGITDTPYTEDYKED